MGGGKCPIPPKNAVWKLSIYHTYIMIEFCMHHYICDVGCMSVGMTFSILCIDYLIVSSHLIKVRKRLERATLTAVQ